MTADINKLDDGSYRFLAVEPELQDANTFHRVVTHPVTGIPMSVKVWWVKGAEAAGLYVPEITAADIARVLDQSLVKYQNSVILDPEEFFDRLLEASDIIRATAMNGGQVDIDMMNEMLGIMPVPSYSWVGTDPTSGRRYPVHATAGEGHENFSSERFAWFCEEIRSVYGGRFLATGALGAVPSVAFCSIGVPQIGESQAWRTLGMKPFIIAADGFRSNRRLGLTGTEQVAHCANTIPARGEANVAITHNANGEINMIKAIEQADKMIASFDDQLADFERMANAKTTMTKLLNGDKDTLVWVDGKLRPFPGLAPILKGEAAAKKGAETVRDKLRDSLQWTLDNLVKRTITGTHISALDAWMVGDGYDQWVRQGRERKGYKQPLAERQGLDLLTGTGGSMGTLALAYADALVGVN